ncbi:MAG: putative Histidine kinase [Candidatus Thorarchaeota archaeon]|nr:MAG: putative Histidine kinase [Candidatus Thorarchaeota archaeon]
MSRIEDSRGFVVIANEDGQITHILRDDIHIFDEYDSLPTLLELMDSESVSKAESFLSAIRTEKAIYGWEMNLVIDGKVTLVYFVGAAHQNEILLIASTDPYGTHSYFDELIRINNDQVNAFRTALKDVFLMSTSESEQVEEMYTRFMQLNNELAAMQRDLARKNRELIKLNEQKSRFIGMMAHDLRSPLTSIVLLSDFVLLGSKERLALDEIEALEQITKMSKYMANIIGDLLDLSVIESGHLTLKKERKSIAESIQRCVKLNQLIADKKEITIIFRQEGDIPELMMDVSKIDQVINNLISNAIKYSPENTTIIITLWSQNGKVIVDVADEGQGIPKDELGQIFTPYGKTTAKTTGGEKSIGLGLIIVKKIVEAHKGTIMVRSEPQNGATFSFTIPIE